MIIHICNSERNLNYMENDIIYNTKSIVKFIFDDDFLYGNLAICKISEIARL